MFCNQPHYPARTNAVTTHKHFLNMPLFIGIHQIKRFRKLSAKRKNIADLYRFFLHQLIRRYPQVSQYLVGVHFLIDGNFFTFMHINRVLADVRQCLKFVAIFREATAGSKCLVSNIANSKPLVNSPVCLRDNLIKFIVLCPIPRKRVQIFH